MPQAGWEPVHPHGLALAVLVVTIVFTAIMSIVFFLRIGVRLRYQELVREDIVMGVGYVRCNNFIYKKIITDNQRSDFESGTKCLCRILCIQRHWSS